MEHDPLNARLVAREDLNAATAIFHVAYDDERPIEFIPGQFVNAGCPATGDGEATGKSGLVKRPYSIASAPGKSTVELFVRLVDDGALTPKLWALQPGDALWMDERILGKFTLATLPEEPAAADRDLILVSTGTGLAPFTSMLEHHLDAPLWRRIVLLNGARIASDLGYRARLEQLDAEREDVIYRAVLSRAALSQDAEDDWTGARGRVQQLLEPATFEAECGFALDPAHAQIMLCGNPAMIDEVLADLQARGFQKHSRKEPGQVHFERYW
jgi:ferredoxin--NADP+ reductase